MKQIDEIVQTLIINGTLTEQPGLFYGKTGIAVFFFHYARQTGNGLFQEYAFDLIEEVREQLNVTNSVRYDTGLAGIGVGFEYFIQNGFIEAEDDFFDDFDARMYRAAMYEPYPDLSLQEGLTGWGRYLIYRIRGNGYRSYKLNEALKHIAKEIVQRITKNAVPENEQPDVYRFFHDLMTLSDYAKKYADTFKQCRVWKCIRKPDIKTRLITSLPFSYLDNLQRLYVCQNYFKLDLTEEIGKEWENRKELDFNSLTNLELLNGLTAEGLLYLTLFHNLDKSWLNLL